MPFNTPRTNFVCQESECKLGKRLFKITAVPGLQTKGSMPCHALMVALSVTKTSIKEILSDNETWDHPLPYSAFDMSLTQAGYLRESFRSLKNCD